MSKQNELADLADVLTVSSGDLTLTGDLTAVDATLSGDLVAADATLSGGVYLGGTGSANYLDDYEEGTWTPTIQGAGTAGSYTSNYYAFYRKVGDMVTVWVSLINITGSGGTGAFNVTGLPFTITASHAQGPITIPRFRQANNVRDNLMVVGLANSNSVLIEYNNNGSGGGNDVPITDIFSGGTDLSFNFSYVAS